MREALAFAKASEDKIIALLSSNPAVKDRRKHWQSRELLHFPAPKPVPYIFRERNPKFREANTLASARLRIQLIPTPRQKLGGYAKEHLSPIGKSSFSCSECGSPCFRDERYDIVCGKCGLVQEKLKDESWKAYEEVVFEGESESDDWFVDASYGSFSSPKEFWNKQQNEPMPHHNRPGGIKKNYWPFTHGLYLVTPVWVGCSYRNKCNHRSACAGCDYRIELSFRERERGLLKGEMEDKVSQIDRRFSWPYQCLASFRWLPNIDRYGSLSDGELALYYKDMNAKYSGSPTYNPMPESASTIKKRRPKGKTWGGVPGPNNTIQGPRAGIPPYIHNVYRGTPIGDLLEEHPKTGREALFNLFSYFICFALGTPMDELTRENLIKFSMNIMPLHSKKPLKRDLAEKHCELLTRYKVVHILKRFGPEGLLYMALPQRMRGIVHWSDLP